MRWVLWVLLLPWVGSLQAQLSDFGELDFRRADSMADVYRGTSLKDLPLLAHQLTAPLPTQVEQFRAIYTWVCKNISNHHGDYLRNKKNREKFQHDTLALAQWNAKFRKEEYQKLLKRRETVCTGFAYLVKVLAELAGITCKIIDGYGRTANVSVEEVGIPNHNWNAVLLDGRWYLCDPTWSGGYMYLPTSTYVFDYHDGYFLAEPALFAMNHYPLDTAWLLMESKPSFRQYVEGPFIYKDAFKHQMLPLEPGKMNVILQKHEELRLLFRVPDDLKAEDIRLELGKKGHLLRPDVRWTEDGLLEVRYVFHRRIFRDVHIKVGDEYIATYTVRVRKGGIR